MNKTCENLLANFNLVFKCVEVTRKKRIIIDGGDLCNLSSCIRFEIILIDRSAILSTKCMCTESIRYVFGFIFTL